MIFIISSIVNFLVVVAILWHFGRKPIAKFFADRSQSIEGQILDAEGQYFEAEKALTQWEGAWKSCEAHAKEIRDEAQVTIERLRKQALESARCEAERIREEGQLLTRSESTKVRRDLQRELVERSVAMARGYLEKQMDEGDKHKLVTDYVEILGHGAHG